MQIKKFLALAGSAMAISFVSITNLRAADAPAPDYLAIIADNTTNILEKVNKLPTYIEGITAYIMNWQKEDKSQSSADMQVNFNAIGEAIAKNLATQNGQQAQIAADMVGVPIANFTNPKESPSILKGLPQINSLSYATLLGTPPAPKASTNPYDYIKNAAGLTYYHDIPDDAAGGTPGARDRYKKYYNTIMAVESYDGYILSGLLAEAQNENALTIAQNNLLAQASNSGWISTIASEELGVILRQILMFQSQTYVLLTQLLQTQKQQLAATAMTNTLLIMNGQTNESILLGRAQGSTP